jgi:hypothetical protein
MKHLSTFSTLVLALAALTSSAGVVVLEGNYQGKNIFVQNPFSDAGVGYCVYEVMVNDLISTDEINSSAFEIDMKAFELKMGQDVVIKIKHKDGCSPIVLNPEVLKPKSTFEVLSIGMEGDGVLSWTTSNETGELPFTVEQKRWNKWVKAGEVIGIGTPGEHTYQFKVTPHSGENTFRVKQVDYSKKPRYSESVTFNDPSVQPITFSPDRTKKTINFSGTTLYEIYDGYGNIIKKGYGNEINVINMQKDKYYLNYDNKMGETFIKK